MSAYVEVTFDNSDGRFHNNGKNEFVLRRTIGAKKDEYSMDRKNSTKREVFEMLEAAGLSRSNPFYIVPQGRVTAITNMKDEERLNLLKEISGSNVYEKRRADSLKLMTDTDQKCERIDELVKDINARLQELEGEKKELEAWNKNDRERRALLYTMNARRENDLEVQIERIEQARHNGVADTDTHKAQFLQNEADMQQIDTQINNLKSEIKLLNDERAQQETDRKVAARHKAALELERADLTEGQSAAQQSHQRLDADLKRVRQEIQDRKTKLSKLMPKYEAKKEEETNVRAQLAEAGGQRKRLEEKQGRSASYSTRRQRDDALRKRVDNITLDLSTRKSIQMQTNEDMQAVQHEINFLEQEIADLEAKLEGEGDNTLSLGERIQKAQEAYDALYDQQSTLLRDDNRINAKLDNAKVQLRHAEVEFSHLLDHATSKGLQTLRRLQDDNKIDGIHGTVAELFQVSEPYKIATEVAAGPALFSVVCDNDSTAAKAIGLLEKSGGGRLPFRAINRIRGKPANVPHTADAQPLLPKLRFDPVYKNIFEDIFAKVVVCPELSICQSLARNHDVLALTPDGDRAHKKGGYHGGYFDPSKSKLDAHRKAVDLREQLNELQESKSSIQSELDSLRQKLTAAASEIRKAGYQKKHAEDGYLPMRQTLRTKQADLLRKTNTLKQMQDTARDIQAAMNELASQQSDLEEEISSDFKKALSRDEEVLLQSLTGTMRDLNGQLSALTDERSGLESEKLRIEAELRENLNPHYDQLLAQQKGAGGSGGQSAQLKECERALKAANKTVAAFDSRIQELDEQRQEENEKLVQYEETKAEKGRSNRELAKLMEKAQKSMDRKLADRAQYRDELAAVQRDIRELGTLPEEAYQKFTRWSADRVSSHLDYKRTQTNMAQLVNELEKVNKALKKYSHVNKKAFQQYEDFTRRREQLTSRRGELNTSRDAIENLVEVLDQRKDEAIARTFKQVSKYFQEVFVQLVPAGTGRLIIQRRSDREARRGGDAESDDEDDERAQARAANGKTSVENYTGVGIAVSFNSKHDEQQRIQQLSGGQKALCALALVFAIQQCDPAPFYLFDEIDANLDAQYRTAVAEMLRKLSGKGGQSGEGGGQFICTTFRPEMVLVADKCYAVSYKNSASKIDVFDREGALAFVETSQKVAGR